MCSQLLSLGHPCIKTGPITPHEVSPKIFPRLLLLVIELRQTSSLDIDFLTFEKWKALILNLASIVYTVLSELDIGAKLLSITGDNASSNPAMAGILSGMLEADFDTEIFSSGNTRPVVRYQGEARFVRCLVNILNLIVKEFLVL